MTTQDVLGCDETIASDSRALAVLSATTITPRHKYIGSEFVQRVMAILDRQPKIKTYGINEESYATTENITFDLDGKATMTIAIRMDKVQF